MSGRVYQPVVEYRWLLGLLERTSMEANEVLGLQPRHPPVHGVLEEWIQTSVDLGSCMITRVIVRPATRPQRFLLQYDTVHQWMARRNVEIIPHSTHRDKSDPEFGVEVDP